MRQGTLLAFVDIKKAYDNVDLDILNRVIISMHPPDDVLQEWFDELADLRALNMDVCGEKIKRSNGLPQGSELAPMLFNIYTTHILNNLVTIFPPINRYEVKVFADNWVIASKAISRNEMINLIYEINAWLFTNYKLEFTMDEMEIQQIDGKTNTDEKPILKHEIPFLGVKWKFDMENKLYFDYADYKWDLPPIKLLPGYSTFRFIKKFIVPKFRYYYDYLSVIQPDEANKYIKWFRNALIRYIRKQCNMIKIHGKLIDELIKPTDPNKIWRKFITPYLAKENEIWNENSVLTLEQIQLLEQVRKMATLCVEQDIKFGIYQASNYLFSNKSPQEYFKNNRKCQRNRERNRTWMILDTLYFAITAEKRISTVIFNEQENYMNKTSRRRTYKIF
jgi:hypothetical protein